MRLYIEHLPPPKPTRREPTRREPTTTAELIDDLAVDFRVDTRPDARVVGLVNCYIGVEED